MGVSLRVKRRRSLEMGILVTAGMGSGRGRSMLRHNQVVI